MKRIKAFTLIFAIIICLSFVFVACIETQENPTTHTHNYSTNWMTSTTEHWHECQNDGCDVKKTDVNEHVDDDNDGKCDVCDYVMSEVHIHSLTLVPAVNATCTENGNVAYYVCSSCEKWFSDENGENEVEDHASVVLPSGHAITLVPEVSATCTENGNVAYYACSSCDKWFSDENGGSEIEDHASVVVSASGHAFDGNSCVLCGVAITEGLEFTYLEEEDAYEVSGIGTATDTDLIIPSEYNGKPVISIGEGAFYGCDSLTSITIPDSVISIGVQAFVECYSLISINVDKNNSNYSSINGSLCDKTGTELICVPGGLKGDFVIPECVTNIYDLALAYCTSLVGVTIGSNVTNIGEGAFLCCSTLDSVIIGNGVTEISSYAFFGCTSLTSIIIPDSVSSIGEQAFLYCMSLVSINVDENNSNYSSINGALYNKEVTELICVAPGLKGNFIIPESVTTICDYAFYECSSLTSVIITDSVTSIGERAFYDCSSLVSVTIGDNVTNIGENAFSGCDSLTSITIPDRVTNIGEGAFFGCTSLTSIIIPDSVTSIGDRAFAQCDSLVSVTIGNSVTSIGDWAFAQCDSLVTLTIGNSVTEISSYAFYWCRSLTSVIIPDSVTSIGDWAFAQCDSLVTLSIGNSVTEINSYAFYWCKSLTSVTIPDSVTSIGERAFDECYSLVEVYNKSALNIEKGSDDYGYVGCYAKDIFTTEFESKLSITDEGYILYTDGEITSLIKYIGSETSLTLPDGITEINSYAFYWCQSLTSVTIPDSVKWIYQSAFEGCTSLTSITIPDSVIRVFGEAFKSCESLTSVTIGSNVTRIEACAFWDCRSLTSITIPNSVTEISSYAFRNCVSLTSIIIPDSVKWIYNSPFDGCDNLTIYCEAESQPSGWDSEWNSSNCPVIWGYKSES